MNPDNFNKIHSHSLNKYLLKPYNMPATVLGSKDTAVNKNKHSCPQRAFYVLENVFHYGKQYSGSSKN